MNRAANEPWQKWIVAILFLSIVAWGLFHAVGAMRLNNNLWRGAVVLGCVVAFLSWWLLLLWRRGRAGSRRP